MATMKMFIRASAAIVPAAAIAIYGDWTHLATFVVGGLSFMLFEAFDQ